MATDPPPFTRRRFLAAAGSWLAAVWLAACGVGEASRSPGASSSSSGEPSETPSPSPTATPAPTPIPAAELRRRIGQMLLIGFRGLTVAEAAGIAADIAAGRVGGILLFDTDQPTRSAVRNVASPAQLRALVAGLQGRAGTPLFVAVDEEGGLVARLGPSHGFPGTTSAADLGARNDPVFTRARGKAIAETLASVGVNLNLAPVVDLDVNPDNPIIGSLGRSFSASPAVVASQATAFIEGHRDVGVGTTIKHFPGHGSSTGDTHLGVVDVTSTWSEIELQPFAELAAAGLPDAVLTAHVFNAKLDPEHPATLSEPTVTGILRSRLGWDGLVISDDMQMGAIRKAYGYEDAVRLALLAGVDVLTIAQQQLYEVGIAERTVGIIERLVTSGAVPLSRIDESYARIMAVKDRLA